MLNETFSVIFKHRAKAFNEIKMVNISFPDMDFWKAYGTWIFYIMATFQKLIQLRCIKTKKLKMMTMRISAAPMMKMSWSALN